MIRRKLPLIQPTKVGLHQKGLVRIIGASPYNQSKLDLINHGGDKSEQEGATLKLLTPVSRPSTPTGLEPATFTRFQKPLVVQTIQLLYCILRLLGYSYLPKCHSRISRLLRKFDYLVFPQGPYLVTSQAA